MRKAIITIGAMALLASFLMGALPQQAETDSNPGDLKREIYRLYGEKKFDETLKLIDKALKIRRSGEFMQMKYNILMAQKKFDEALVFVDAIMADSGESEEMLSARYNVLMAKEDYPAALKAAAKKDQMAPDKNPWDAMNMVHTYLKMGRKNDALDWLQESVSRGFISYRILEEGRYASLEKEQRFYQIIETIKVSIGLGHPAKDFTVPLLSGQNISLKHLRGSVVLVVFWATWCDPCLGQLPHIKRYYEELKDKGFEVVAVSLDSSSNRAKSYMDKLEPGWKNLCSGRVWQDKVVKLYGINNIPSYWLIDKKGVLRAVDLKGMELKQAIFELLKEQ